MADRWVRKWCARGRLSGVFAPLAMNVVEPFGLEIIRLKIVVGNRPSRRKPAEMPNFSEVFPTKAEKRAAVVVCVRVESLSVLVAPLLFGLILAFDVDGARIPVGLFATNVITAFHD